MHSKMNFRFLSLFFIAMVSLDSSTIQAAELELEYVGSLGGKIRDAVACQGFVFLAQGNSIIILDAKDKYHFREISRYQSGSDSVNALAVKWPILFFIKKWIGGSYSEVATLEIKDLAHPREIILKEQLGGVDLATSGSLLLANMRSRLQLYDVSDPYHPKIISPKTAYETWEWGTDIGMIEKLKPPLTIPGDVLYSGGVHGVVAEGQSVYLLDDSASLKAFDLTDPQKPRPIVPIANADKIKFQIESQVKAFNKENKTYRDHFRIIREERQDDGKWGDQITIQDIANKNVPRRLSSCAKLESTWSSIEKFGIIGDHLFVVVSESQRFYKYSLSIYDIRNPEKPIFIGKSDNKLWEIPGNIAVSGDRIYLADHDRGLIVLRFTKAVKSHQNP